MRVANSGSASIADDGRPWPSPLAARIRLKPSPQTDIVARPTTWFVQASHGTSSASAAAAVAAARRRRALELPRATSAPTTASGTTKTNTARTSASPAAAAPSAAQPARAPSCQARVKRYAHARTPRPASVSLSTSGT